MKFCPDCGATKPLDEFYRHGSTQSGRQTYCKPCFNVRQKRWYVANKVRRNQQTASVRRLKLLRSGGRETEPTECEVCKCAPDSERNGRYSNGKVDSSRRLAYDHDHATGKFRGWLCHRCNAALGLMNDDPALIRALADYLGPDAVAGGVKCAEA